MSAQLKRLNATISGTEKKKPKVFGEKGQIVEVISISGKVSIVRLQPKPFIDPPVPFSCTTFSLDDL